MSDSTHPQIKTDPFSKTHSSIREPFGRIVYVGISFVVINLKTRGGTEFDLQVDLQVLSGVQSFVEFLTITYVFLEPPPSSMQMSEPVPQQDETQIGSLIAGNERRRDAIHVAVAPVTAVERLAPGQHIGLRTPGDTEHVSSESAELIGIVDPFLSGPIAPGERFWMFLYPSTVTGMRHAWQHPSFERASQLKRQNYAASVTAPEL